MTEADLDRANLASDDMLLDRAVRLFAFLGRAQQLRNQPVRDVETYRRDGVVLWLKDLPHHPALHSALNQGEPTMNDTLLRSRNETTNPLKLASWQVGGPTSTAKRISYFISTT